MKKYIKPNIDIAYFDEAVHTGQGIVYTSNTLAVNEQNYVVFNKTNADATTTVKIQQFNEVIKFE